MIRHVVTQEQAGRRLDTVLAELEPELSRARVQGLIQSGAITVGGRGAKPSSRVRAGDEIAGALPAPEPSGLEPEDIPLRIAFEDAELIVVDKPAGLVVHPAAGNRTGTLVHALLFHCGPALSGIGGVTRPGIVHRLDKGTSGLLVAAKSDRAHRSLAAQFKAHSIEREYLALVRGVPKAGSGTVDAPIGRHPSERKRFTTRVRGAPGARHAVTHWRVERRFGTSGLCLVRVRLETGRTHQIRVHMASIGLPVAGDPVYGGGRRVSTRLGLERQALHAAVLGFEHPTSGESVRFESALPEDLAEVVAELEAGS